MYIYTHTPRLFLQPSPLSYPAYWQGFVMQHRSQLEQDKPSDNVATFQQQCVSHWIPDRTQCSPQPCWFATYLLGSAALLVSSVALMSMYVQLAPGLRPVVFPKQGGDPSKLKVTGQYPMMCLHWEKMLPATVPFIP